MPPVPNEGDLRAPTQLVSKEPPDIENLLKLNPRIKSHANAVPSAVTKKVNKIVKGLQKKTTTWACNKILQTFERPLLAAHRLVESTSNENFIEGKIEFCPCL